MILYEDGGNGNAALNTDYIRTPFTWLKINSDKINEPMQSVI